MTIMDNEALNTLLDTARKDMAPVVPPLGGLGVPLPEGWRLEILPPVEPSLPRIRQAVNVLDAASFNSYVNRFKGDADKTTLFADYRKPVIKAVIDYHNKSSPDYLAHTVSFVPPWSEQWARWREIDLKPQSQNDFAEFIEENMQDIVAPEGAVFLDLVTGLQAKKKVSFESGLRLSDGSNQLTYSEEVEAKGRNSMVVPGDFTIGIPVFFGGVGYRVRVFLRYRIDGGKLFFVIKINRRLFVEQTAFADITADIAKETGLIVLNGAV